MAQTPKKIGTWVILGLLFVGLIGFGTTGLNGTVRTIGSVGEKDILATDYARELTDQLRAFQAQTGQPIPFPQAQALGLDRATLSQLVATRALDNEAARLGLSAGDLVVAEQVESIGAFNGLDGSFDREGYTFALRQQGLTVAQFEDGIREEIARTFLQGAVVAGVPAPTTYADALSRFVGEERDIRYIVLTKEALDLPPLPPSPEELVAFHQREAELFTAPEARVIDYAWLTPSMIQDDVELDEAALQELYNERLAEFVQPERRLVERLVMEDEAAAEEALAQVQVGAATFDTLVADRGLNLTEADMGDVAEADLGAAAEGVFAADVGEVVGPLPSDFGPALFRVNAILEATEVSFEEALPDLREELSLARAIRIIAGEQERINDLMAGGAGVTDLAEATAMELGQITWSEEVTEGIAAYSAFREAAARAQTGSFPELLELDDGGIFALTVTEVIPPALRPYEEVQDAVLEAWLADATYKELQVLAERFGSLIIRDGDFKEDMPEVRTEIGLTRRSFVPDAPGALVEEVFDVSEGALAMAEDGTDTIVLAVVDAIRMPDPNDTEVAARAEAIAEQAAAEISQDLMTAFMTQIQEQTPVQLDQAAINAVHATIQ